MLELEKKSYSRSDLFSLVWQHTMLDIARACNVSNVLMKKFCGAWDIPVPSKAQRGKLMSGRRLKIPSLPPSTEGDPTVLDNGDGQVSRRWPTPRPRPSRKKDRVSELREAIAALEPRPAGTPAASDEVETYVYKVFDWRTVVRIGYFGDRTVTLVCEIVAPRRCLGRVALIELCFEDELDEYNGRGHESASQKNGTSAFLQAPASWAPAILQMLSAGRFRYLQTHYHPIARHFSEKIVGFDFVDELEDCDA